MRHKFPRFSLHPFAPSGLFLLLFAMPHIYAFSVISTVCLHEAGHLIAALLFGKRPESIKLMPTGISIGLSPSFSYIEELTIVAAGPLMNLLYIAIAPLFPSEVASTVTTVSLVLGVLNLLPIGDFDGARMLGAVLSLLFTHEIAEGILQISTALTLCILWILSLYIFFYSGVNLTLLLFCAYLFSFFMLKNNEKSCHLTKDMVNCI